MTIKTRWLHSLREVESPCICRIVWYELRKMTKNDMNYLFSVEVLLLEIVMFFEELRGNFSEILRSGDCGVKWKIRRNRKKKEEKYIKRFKLDLFIFEYYGILQFIR